MQENHDRRVRRTNRTLAAALIELTAERPYHTIQVRDITDRADVGYATFYRHFDSKDDLMLSVFADIMEDLESSAGNQGSDYFFREGVLLFEHVSKYPALFSSIIQNPGFSQKLRKLLCNRIESHIAHHTKYPANSLISRDLAAHHMMTSLIGLIEWWLENGQKKSVEEMAHIYDRLVVQGTWIVLTHDDQTGTWKTDHRHN